MLFRRLALLVAPALAALTLAACGGGGGGGSSLPATGGPPPPVTSSPATTSPATTPSPGGTPTATPIPGTSYTPVPNQTGSPAPLSAFTVTSNPTGLAVLLDNSPIGNTPLTNSPKVSSSSHILTIRPGGSTPDFSVTLQQQQNGAKSFFYNQTTDTQGSISVSTIQENAYAPKSVASGIPYAAPAARRAVNTSIPSRPHFTNDTLYVTYRTTALASGRRTAKDIEGTEAVKSGIDVGGTIDGEQTRVVQIDSGANIDTVASRLRAHSEVASVRRVQKRYLEAVTPVTPNDTHFNSSEQWDMFRISAPNAWGYSLGNGSASSCVASSIGSATPPVTVAVLDTGIDDTSQDLTPKVTFAERVVNGVVSSGLTAARDYDGHGTNVAGIAAAMTNNGYGYAGVGYNTCLQIYDIFPQDSNQGSSSADEARAIYDAVANGANVINLSLGLNPGDPVDVTERTAIQFAISKGVVVVAAAGNETSSVLDYPAGYDGVISVGATGLDTTNPSAPVEKIASYTNWGPTLSLVAPGGDPVPPYNSDNNPLHWISGLYSTFATPKCSQSSSDKVCDAFIAGTSQATPHVSGAAALVISKMPSGMVPSQIPGYVTQVLRSTADDLGDPIKQGAGRLNIYRALAAITGDTISPGYVPKANQFIAFAYANSGGATPQILDTIYPNGAPVSVNGIFRIADVPQNAPPYKIGVWYDANANGKVDAGDYFAVTATCSQTGPCAATNLSVKRLTTNGLP